MIEFSGYLSGNAERYFWKRSATLGQILILIGMLVCLPFPLGFVDRSNNWYPVIGYLAFWMFFILIFPFLHKSKKDKEKMLPFKITIQDDYIVVQTKTGSESRKIDEVNVIYDYGEWYAFAFPVGKVSMNFICQKDLLSKGSLKEFEDLFEGKIINKK